MKPKKCPKCGSVSLARGKAFTIGTPKLLRLFGQLHGVTCVNCGYYAPTVRAWNRRKRNE